MQKMAKMALDPKSFTKGSVEKKGSVREPLLIEGTLSTGGPLASDFTRLHNPCVVQGQLNSENSHFESPLQVQGHGWLKECKVNGPAAFVGQLSAEQTAFKDQITTLQGSRLKMEKCRAQDIKIEAAPWRWKWMARLARWIGRARLTLIDSSIHSVLTSGNGYGLVVLKGNSKILGRVSDHVAVVDRRPKEVRLQELKTAPLRK